MVPLMGPDGHPLGFFLETVWPPPVGAAAEQRLILKSEQNLHEICIAPWWSIVTDRVQREVGDTVTL